MKETLKPRINFERNLIADELLQQAIDDFQKKKHDIIREKITASGLDVDFDNEIATGLKKLSVSYSGDGESWWYSPSPFVKFGIVSFQMVEPEFDSANFEIKAYVV